MSKKERFKRLSELGCIVCHIFYGVFTPTAIHHLTGLRFRSVGKRASHDDTIGLCPGHHQYGNHDHPSIHTHPERFEELFCTQEELLKITNNIINA